MRRETTETALVVGGGAAGMEAALRIADAGGRVVLIEKEPQFGGRLLRLARSFPRWEDPRDLLAERLARLRGLESAGRVRLLPGKVIESARRVDGGFVVDIRATVQETGADGGLQLGGAPGSSSGGRETLRAAAVVLATGLAPFDAARYGEYGYGIYPGVLTALEFEDRLREWSAGRPADDDRGAGAAGKAQGGRGARSEGAPADKAAGLEAGAPPRAIAFFKCVGSRDRVKGYPYCSKICCMYTAKQAGMVKDLSPDTQCYVFYMDYRAAGKGYEEFVRDVIENKKVRYVRGRPAKVLPSRGRLLVRAEDTLMGVPVEVEVDMVVLAAALVPTAEMAAVAESFGANADEYGFVEAGDGETACCGDRVFVAGSATFPASIGEARQQGAAAAAQVLALLQWGGGGSGAGGDSGSGGGSGGDRYGLEGG